MQKIKTWASREFKAAKSQQVQKQDDKVESGQNKNTVEPIKPNPKQMHLPRTRYERKPCQLPLRKNIRVDQDLPPSLPVEAESKQRFDSTDGWKPGQPVVVSLGQPISYLKNLKDEQRRRRETFGPKFLRRRRFKLTMSPVREE